MNPNNNNNQVEEGIAVATEGPQKAIEESVINQLKNRMLVSGEWLRYVHHKTHMADKEDISNFLKKRLQKRLMVKLTGSEWEENLRCEAEDSIPVELKQEISASIRAFIKANIQHDHADDKDQDQDEDEEDDAAMEEVV
ncbi:uncharacterized protein VP01_100g19 [Puccinia sorghi]|uniref:Transcription and mRNA export factor SUS1 n=1 Tax=Puccinia sorghi TaxID=27349 RepID=A0A0L6VWH1_9BASI|nr:uncharacterized protein VP01_100g19 [Puccinia sorghi]